MRRIIERTYLGYVAYGLARSIYKTTSSPEVRTERARLPPWCLSQQGEDDGQCVQKSGEDRQKEEFRRRNETRPLLLIERATCVAASPVTTIMRIPSDLQALEVLAKRHDPSAYALDQHPFYNSSYNSVLDFIFA